MGHLFARLVRTRGGRLKKIGALAGFTFHMIYEACSSIKEFERKEPLHDSPMTLLALNPDRFRGDLEALSDSGFRVICLPMSFHGKLVEWFCPIEERGPDGDYFDLTSHRLLAARKRLRRYLRRLLPALYARLNVQAVIGAAILYRQDYDWGVVSTQLGYPYVVLHRENLAVGEGHIRYFRNKVQGKTFEGSHIIVHNDTVREAFVREAFVSPDRITALGCIRMDNFIKRIASYPKDVVSRPLVTLFSFNRSTGLYGLVNYLESCGGLVELFKKVHQTIGRLASDRPDVDFVIKTKGQNAMWNSEISDALAEVGLDLQQIPNLRISHNEDPHELILASNVVCAFGSTTLLEAGIVGKHVILPIFAEARLPAYSDYIHFKDQVDAFNIARSAEDLSGLILELVEETEPNPDHRRRCEHLFEKYVSSLDANATARYAEKIRASIEQCSKPCEDHSKAILT